MTGLVFAILFGLNFVSFPCEGKIFLPDDGGAFVVLPGGNVTIAWKIDPTIPVSDLIIRQWKFLSTGQTLADIVANGNVTIKNTTFAAWIEIIKPSTLVLKNVDKRFNGKYQFEIRYGAGFMQDESEVQVFVAVTPMVSVNCSSSITLDKGDFFACECKGEGGNPLADVTWYKDNVLIVSGKEKAIFRFPNVDKDDSGTYRCEAKSGHEKANNETTMELIVNYPAEKTNLNFTKNGNTSVTITCAADAHPAPTFEILLNEKFVISNKTFTIPYPVNDSDVGCYKCVAVHILGNKSSDCKYLSAEGYTVGATTTHLPTISSTKIITTTMQGNKTALPTTYNKTAPPTTYSNTDKPSSNDASSGIEWYIIAVILVSGIIIVILLSYIVWCSRRRWLRNRKPEQNPQAQTTEADTTYQALDLTKMNTEDNYQSLRKTKPQSNPEPVDTTYQALDLSKMNSEDNYQSLRNRGPQLNPKPKTTEADTTYQELDLSKMNTEDNYQSLRVNAASNEAVNDDESTYTELSKTRDVEDNYQSLT